MVGEGDERALMARVEIASCSVMACLVTANVVMMRVEIASYIFMAHVVMAQVVMAGKEIASIPSWSLLYG